MRARTVRRLVISPCPPVLLPGATGRETVPEVERLRAVIGRAVDWLREPGEPVLVLTSGEHGEIAGGTPLSASAFGLGYRTRLGDDAGGRELAPRTPGLLVAGYLLAGHPAEGIEVADVQGALRQVGDRDPSAVLVCGGGSARRRDGAPGYIDERAVPYDDVLAAMIASADLPGLAEADPRLADELLCDLARPLAVAARIAGRWADPVRASLDEYAAPHGVANLVARWWTDA